MISRKLLFAIAPVIFAISACSPLRSSQPSAAIYSLHARESAPMTHNVGGTVIAIARPTLPAGFDTDKIALYFEDGRRLEYYANALWAARLDTLLHDVILEKARGAYPQQIVETADAPLFPHYRILVKVTDFQPTYAEGPDMAPRLDVTLSVTMIGYPDEKVVKHFTVKQTRPAPDNNLTSITAGLEELLSGALDTAFRMCGDVFNTAPPELNSGDAPPVRRRFR